MHKLIWPLILLFMTPSPGWAQPSLPVKNVVIYREKGRFAGWPANHGIWSWGNEILVGFARGYHKDNGNSHNIDHARPEDHLLARSLDGGKNWVIEEPNLKGDLVPAGDHLFGIPRPGVKIPAATACPGNIDFQHPGFAINFKMFTPQKGQTHFFYSYDRGKNWEGPFRFSLPGLPGSEGRSNYIVNGPHDLTFFSNTIHMESEKGTIRRSFCARTRDGGKTWKFIAWVGPLLEQNSIMPTAVRISPTELYCVTRRRVRPRAWLAAFRSSDEGKTWMQPANPVEETGVGNPGCLIRLADGRLCLTYAVRSAPYRVCAKLSADKGATWSAEIVLRSEGGNRDIGYPRTVQRPDGKIVTVYYFWDQKSGPERYIAATIWAPKARVPEPFAP